MKNRSALFVALALSTVIASPAFSAKESKSPETAVDSPAPASVTATDGTNFIISRGAPAVRVEIDDPMPLSGGLVEEDILLAVGPDMEAFPGMPLDVPFSMPLPPPPPGAFEGGFGDAPIAIAMGPMGHHRMRMGGGGMLSGLNLTDDQYEKIYAIKKDTMAKSAGKMAELFTAHMDLRDLMSQAQVDRAKVQAVQSKLNSLKADLSNIRLDSQLNTLAVLTDEQRHEIRRNMVKRMAGGGGGFKKMHRMGKRGGGGPGGPGCPAGGPGCDK